MSRYQRPYRKKEEEESGASAGLFQIVICLAILGGVLFVRWLYPEPVKAFLNEHIASGMDYTEVLSDVGGSLRTFFGGAPRPEDLPSETEGSPSDGTEASPSPSEGDSSPTDGAEESPSPSSEEEETSPPTEEEIRKSDNLSDSLFAQSALLVNSAYITSDKVDIDNTDPIPFGTTKPEKVDYSVYPIPFETHMPVDTVRITSGFGFRNHPIYGELMFHYGLDFAAPSGTAIYAFADGTVESTGYSDAYGNYLLLRHADGFATMYGHCRRVLVSEGDSVTVGQTVAEVGMTGLSTGPHLHFEIRKDAALLNPAYYLSIPDENWAV